MRISKITLIVVLFANIAAGQNKREFVAPNRDVRAYVVGLKHRKANSESQIKIVDQGGKVLFDTSFASMDGEHGLVVVNASWTPNSQFFVFSTSSSGGHQPWHSPTFFYSTKAKKLFYLDDLIGVITTSDFVLSGEDSLYTVGMRKDDLDEEDLAVSLSSIIHRK